MVCTSPTEALAAQSISLFTAQLAAEIAAGLAPQLSWATRKIKSNELVPLAAKRPARLQTSLRRLLGCFRQGCFSVRPLVLL